MKKIISFSLWGDSKIYCQGAIENIKLAEKYYKGWIPRFYISENCPALRSIQYMGAETIIMPPLPKLDKTKSGWENCPTHRAMMWRFLPLSDSTVYRMISRDCDSRISPRCYDSTLKWEDSGALATVLYECSQHRNGVMGGMWGSVCNIHGDIEESINTFLSKYLDDYPGQRWVFADIIYCRDYIISPIAFSTLFQGYGTQHPFEIPMTDGLGRFIGDIVGEEMRGQVWTEESFNEEKVSRSISQ